MATRLRWLSSVARHRWYAVIGTGACITAAVSGVLMSQPHKAAHHPRALAADCGIVTCTASIPPPAAASAASATASPRRSPGRPHATTAPRVTLPPTSPPVPPAGPAATPASPPPARPSSPAPRLQPLTVSYSVVQRWDGGLQGQFTIANHSATALAGWELVAVFPGDQVDSAWGSGFHISGDTLILVPSYPPAIPPGASQSMHFTAQGNTTSPASCTLDGAACG
jgi:Cellulose binding domain